MFTTVTRYERLTSVVAASPVPPSARAPPQTTVTRTGTDCPYLYVIVSLSSVPAGASASTVSTWGADSAPASPEVAAAVASVVVKRDIEVVSEAPQAMK